MAIRRLVLPGLNVWALGRSCRALAGENELLAIRQQAGLGANAAVTNYRRMFLNQEVVQGTTYRRVQKRKNCVVHYRNNDGKLLKNDA